MKHPEAFSHEAILRRSQQVARELEASASSAKAKRELDDAAMDKKERRTLKEFQAFRAELNDGVEDLAEHVNVARSVMPPNILILRRKTVRQFPDGVMVALYYNDKLGLQFSIPYGGDLDSVVTPVALKEAERKSLADLIKDQEAKDKATQEYHKARERVSGITKRAEISFDKATTPLKEEQLAEDRGRSLGIDGHSRAQWMDKFERHVVAARPEHGGKIGWHIASKLHGAGHKPEDAATLYRTSLGDRLEEGVIDQLRHIKDFHAVKGIKHDDKTQTHVDPTTAHALLTVHDALSPLNQKQFAYHLQHSKPKFHKMLDFAWKKVK